MLMKTMFRLTMLSLTNRWLTATLTILAVAISVMLLLGVEKIKNGAKSSFANTISGTDVIVGARTGSVQLLLYSVFHIGNATNNVSWKSYQDIAKRPEVKWIIPLSLGDSHKGFRVIGTTPDYFRYYQYRNKRALTFSSGKAFEDLFDVVIGADVASALQYKIGDKIILNHGLGQIGRGHKETPFVISGILTKTGTPVDKSLQVSLRAIEAIHVDWRRGYKIQGQVTPIEKIRAMDLTPKTITAAMVGLKSKLRTFHFQRYVNNYRAEALSAVLPAVTLYEMWALVGVAETALTAISIMVVATALLGMTIMILSTLNERRREIAILRANGAGLGWISSMLVGEAALLTLVGTILGTMTLYIVLLLARPIIDDVWGLQLDINPPGTQEMLSLCLIVAAGALAGLVPALMAYRQSLADGMLVKN